MGREKRQYDDDDGRVICEMDLDGMPYQARRNRGRSEEPVNSASGGGMTRSEARRFTANALLAVLLIGTVFSATWILLTLFLTKVLFR